MKRRLSGFQKPLRQPVKQVGLAIISYEADNVAQCSCGTALYHQRAKVCEDKIDRHIAKAHNGRGVRM